MVLLVYFLFYISLQRARAKDIPLSGACCVEENEDDERGGRADTAAAVKVE